MPFSGRHLLPREIAQLGRFHWKNIELVKMVATALGESLGYVGAWHDNIDDSGVATSRDCGLMQISIPAREVGTSVEAVLRTEDLDPSVSTYVAAGNVDAAYHLYEQPWTGRPIRRWQPWVAYTTGWATFPGWWTWHQVEGQPVGPWVPTGRYLQKAIVGISNYHLLIAKDRTVDEAVALAESYSTHFSVAGEVYASEPKVGPPALAWRLPPRPEGPPADGVGPRPIPNDGA